MFITLIFTLSIILNFIAVYFLYSHWKKGSGSNKSFWISIVFILFSLMTWVMISGPEFGTVYWACCSALISWLIIFFQRKSAPFSQRKALPKRRSKIETRFSLSFFSLTTLAQLTSRYTMAVSKLLLVIIIPFIFSASISFILPLASHSFSSNTLMFGFGLFLIIWPISLLEFHKFTNPCRS